MKSVFLLVVISFVQCHSVPGQESVLNARLRPLGSVVTITGVLLNGAELGIVRYLQDSTAGIAIYPGGNSPISFQQSTTSDEISVTGVLSTFHGLLEINPVLSWTKISSGQSLPDPRETALSAIDYHDQSTLVQLECDQIHRRSRYW